LLTLNVPLGVHAPQVNVCSAIGVHARQVGPPVINTLQQHANNLLFNISGMKHCIGVIAELVTKSTSKFIELSWILWCVHVDQIRRMGKRQLRIPGCCFPVPKSTQHS